MSSVVQFVLTVQPPERLNPVLKIIVTVAYDDNVCMDLICSKKFFASKGVILAALNRNHFGWVHQCIQTLGRRFAFFERQTAIQGNQYCVILIFYNNLSGTDPVDTDFPSEPNKIIPHI